jgi:hypothetical protein
MAVETIWTEVAVPAREPALKDPGFIDYHRKEAAQVLAERVFVEAAHFVRIEPDDPEDPNAVVRLRWSVSVERDQDELIANSKRKAADRQKGREQAAGLLEAAAKEYEELGGTQVQSTAKSIANALLVQAQKIRAIPAL